MFKSYAKKVGIILLKKIVNCKNNILFERKEEFGG